jgi:hypothetical protein
MVFYEFPKKIHHFLFQMYKRSHYLKYKHIVSESIPLFELQQIVNITKVTCQLVFCLQYGIEFFEKSSGVSSTILDMNGIKDSKKNFFSSSFIFVITVSSMVKSFLSFCKISCIVFYSYGIRSVQSKLLLLTLQYLKFFDVRVL